MTWLAIDTATARASVAAGTSAADAVEETLDGARQHASALIPMVERVLARRGAALGDVEGIIVADGPGSFTGLRVSAAFAKALVDARGLALRTAPSLLARAAAADASAAGAGGLATAALLATADALRGDRYAGAWRFPAGRVETLLAPRVIRADALADLAAGLGARLVGDEPASARWLLELMRRDGGTTRVDHVQSWEPVYGRPAEAQAKWEREHGHGLPDPAGAAG